MTNDKDKELGKKKFNNLLFVVGICVITTTLMNRFVKSWTVDSIIVGKL